MIILVLGRKIAVICSSHLYHLDSYRLLTTSCEAHVCGALTSQLLTTILYISGGIEIEHSLQFEELRFFLRRKEEKCIAAT